MKRAVILLVLAIMLGCGQRAFAWDPDREPPTGDGPELPWAPDAAPVSPPAGIYLVIDTYAGDSVTHSGALTTYSTETVHETTGSYARVLESVVTGGSSSYDGVAFNGRASLTDGRAVAGTYYENYVRMDGGFVPVSVVFFQDDTEIAREIARASRTAPTPARPGTAGTAPTVDRDEPSPVRSVAQPRPSTLLADRSIEVLRGRRITLPLTGPDVRAWRFGSGEAVALGPLSGSGAEPFVARWDRLAPPNGAWVVRFLIDYADGSSHELALRVTVRAPGLVE